jgi:hypothetical protein
MKNGKDFAGAAELILSALLTACSFTLVRACDSAEGHYMACHWAQNTVTLAGAVLTAAAVIRLFIKNRGAKAGITLVSALLSGAAAFIPNAVINLCLMETMRCHTVFRPAVTVAAAVLAVIFTADAVIGIKRTGRGK